MKTSININNNTYNINLLQPLDISIPIQNGTQNPKAFYAPNPSFEPVKTDTFVGSTELGGLLNFKNVFVNPHGNGTHTECVGHIAKEPFTINQSLKQFHFLAKLISVKPETINNDLVITQQQIPNNLAPHQAVIIRTLPNTNSKTTQNYSGTNPPYFHFKAIEKMVSQGILHLLTDLPSVDREEDEGKLLAHKAFWNYPSNNIRQHCTITEMIYANNHISDGSYLLNLQIASLEVDASPSKPVLYKIN